MTENSRDERPGAEGWLRLSEGLVAGVHHALNNRMAALRAVGQVLETDLPANHPLAGALTTELVRLEQTAGVLALLTADEPDEVPFQISDVIRDAARLFELHHSLRDLRLETSFADGLLPVLGQPWRVLRAILLLIAVAARDGARGIRLRADGDERVVRVRLEGEAGEDYAAETLSIGDAEVDAAVRGAGGSFTREGRGLEMTLLTLPEARRAGRT